MSGYTKLCLIVYTIVLVVFGIILFEAKARAQTPADNNGRRVGSVSSGTMWEFQTTKATCYVLTRGSQDPVMSCVKD